jgi:hypothetical protein
MLFFLPCVENGAGITMTLTIERDVAQLGSAFVGTKCHGYPVIPTYSSPLAGQ